MAGALEIDGKILHSVKDAAQLVSYSRDYITRLAREEKIVASNIGRQWFIDLDSLKQYIETISLEQEIRKKQLSEERRIQRLVRETTQKQHTLHLKKAKTLHARAVSVASIVLVSGLIGGLMVTEFVFSVRSSGTQVAATHTAKNIQSVASDPVVTENSNKVVVEKNDKTSSINNFAQEVRSLGDVQNGILLLPSVGSTTKATEFFSDEVMVSELEDGTEVVVRTDEFGKIVGNPVPFVVVPVKREEI